MTFEIHGFDQEKIKFKQHFLNIQNSQSI